MTNIAILGLGAMGSRLAGNYADAGLHVTVWNRTTAVAEKFADAHTVTVAETPRDAAKAADFVVSMVSNDEAASTVWLDPDTGALAAMHPDAVAIESSTLTPGAVGKLGHAAQGRGVRFIEAPVVGSRPQADAGALFYVLGGDHDVIDSSQHVIDINAGNSIHVGKIGNAATMKLAINGLFAAQVAAYAEIVGFIERSDLDTDDAIESLKALPITSPGLQRILGLISDRDYAPNFPVHLVAKDLGYLARSAKEIGAAVPIVDASQAVFDQGSNGAQQDLDIAGIAQRYQVARS